MFFAIYAGLVNNQRFPRFVRYNGMQAILLDIVLVSRRRRPVSVCPDTCSLDNKQHSLQYAKFWGCIFHALWSTHMHLATHSQGWQATLHRYSDLKM